MIPSPVYVSGPMSHYEDFNFPAFTAACVALRALGLEVLSPHEVGEDGEAKAWADYMRKDLPLLARCRSVVTLEGWQHSRGAVLEVHIAHQLGMPVLPLHVVLGGPAEQDTPQ